MRQFSDNLVNIGYGRGNLNTLINILRDTKESEIVFDSILLNNRMIFFVDHTYRLLICLSIGFNLFQVEPLCVLGQ